MSLFLETESLFLEAESLFFVTKRLFFLTKSLFFVAKYFFFALKKPLLREAERSVFGLKFQSNRLLRVTIISDRDSLAFVSHLSVGGEVRECQVGTPSRP